MTTNQPSGGERVGGGPTGAIREMQRQTRQRRRSATRTHETIEAILARRPEEDQEALAEYARELEARRTGVYRLTEDERAAVREGLEQARRGEFVSDEEMEAFWKRHGV